LAEVLKNPTLGAVVSVLVLRLLATSFCVGTGTVGGVFTPTLFAGAAAGFIVGHLLGVSHPAVFAVAGLSAFLAGVTHAPFMASFLAVELTGQWQLWPLLFCLDLVSYSVARRLTSRSLYAIATPEPNQERRL
jgi:CIC family chloride channel protein